MKDAHMHLTNFSINKKSANFNEKEVDDIYEPNYASKRTLTSVMKQIALRSPEKMEQLKANIKNTCAGTAAMLMNMILHNNHSQLKNQDSIKGTPFQIFGFDVFIDHNFKAWILEVNDHPSFSVVTCLNNSNCRHENCPINKVDLAVKKRVMNAAFQIATLDSMTQTTVEGLEQIVPG